MEIKDCVSQHKIGRNSSLNPVFRKQLASLSKCEIKLTISFTCHNGLRTRNRPVNKHLLHLVQTGWEGDDILSNL